MTCLYEYSKEITLVCVIKVVLLLKQQTIWNHPISPATNRNRSKPPRDHPKLLASPESPATPPCNEPTNLTLFSAVDFEHYFIIRKLELQKPPPEVFCEKHDLKISQNSQENSCAGVFFLITGLQDRIFFKDQDWPNGWVFVYELSGRGFDSRCSHLRYYIAY